MIHRHCVGLDADAGCQNLAPACSYIDSVGLDNSAYNNSETNRPFNTDGTLSSSRFDSVECELQENVVWPLPSHVVAVSSLNMFIMLCLKPPYYVSILGSGGLERGRGSTEAVFVSLWLPAGSTRIPQSSAAVAHSLHGRICKEG